MNQFKKKKNWMSDKIMILDVCVHHTPACMQTKASPMPSITKLHVGLSIVDMSET